TGCAISPAVRENSARPSPSTARSTARTCAAAFFTSKTAASRRRNSAPRRASASITPASGKTNGIDSWSAAASLCRRREGARRTHQSALRMAEDKDLEDLIAGRLRAAGLKFATERAVGGLAPDFVVYAPDGRQFIVQTRDWDFPGLTMEASRQAQHYQDAAKADGAFIVIPGLKRNLPSKGVVTVEGLIPALQAEMQTEKSRTNPAEVTRIDKLVFAAMPFAPQYEDVFFVAMSYAAEQVGAVCDRVDRREFQGNVVDEVHRMIRKASAVIVDLSESKPNVLYEAGYAHALKKPCVHICSTPLEKLPFDVAQWKTTRYEPGQTHKLRRDLTQRLKAIFDS